MSRTKVNLNQKNSFLVREFPTSNPSTNITVSYFSLCELSNARHYTFQLGKIALIIVKTLARAGYNCITCTHTYTILAVGGGGLRRWRLTSWSIGQRLYLFNCDLGGRPAVCSAFWATEWKCCSHADPARALTPDRRDAIPFLISTWTQPEEWHEIKLCIVYSGAGQGPLSHGLLDSCNTVCHFYV